MSMHKAQGLESELVKIVIADETSELIAHSIFCTAITCARNKSKIYWMPEAEQKFSGAIKPKKHQQGCEFT